MRQSKTAFMAVAFQSVRLGARISLATLAACGILGMTTAAAAQVSSLTYNLDIPAQKLDDALQALALASQHKLLYSSRLIQGRASPALKGEYTAEEAVKKLLSGTDLVYQVTSDGLVIIRAPGDRSASMSLLLHSDAEESGVMISQSSPSASIGAGQVEAPPAPSSVTGEDEKLTEVIVTAQKKGVAERLQDVPIPISVVSADSLMQSNYAQIQDYFNQIPGLTIAQAGNGVSIVSIRGITTGQNTNPTVGFTLDDVPLGGSTNASAVSQIPFVNPADLAQVEVLRGPQGTLYGDNSMGGLIRYVTVDPSTDRVFGDVKVGGDGVVNGTHLGYSTSAAINVSLTDTLAIRASAFTRLDPGYVDNVLTGQRGEGLTKAGGGRVAVKWTPTADFSAKLSVLYEKSDRYGSIDVGVPTVGYPQSLGLVGLQQYDVPGTGGYSQELKATNLTLNANLGGVKITSISGYTVSGYISPFDFTYAVGNVPFGGNTPPFTGSTLIENSEIHKFTQEVRLTDSIGSHLEWLLGGFFTQEDNRYVEYLSTADLLTGATAIPGDLYYSFSPGRYREYAGFGALTWKATDRFDVQIGGRETFLSDPNFNGDGMYTGGSFNGEPPGPSTFSPPGTEVYKDKASTYLISPRFKISPDVMIYARVANGFRPGGGTYNPQPTDECIIQHFQCLINPDKTTNYEVGAKADFLNHVLSVDSSVYYIHWTDLQVDLTNSNHINYSGNGSGAKSQGVDLSLNWRPLDGLTVSTWGAWNEAVLTQPFRFAMAGEPLPYAARFSGNLSVEYDVPITRDTNAFLMSKEIYVGDRTGDFTSTGSARQDLPAYSQTNCVAGIKLLPWTFTMYVDNVTDRRGVLYGGIGANAPFTFDYITPRTVGLSVDRIF